MLLEARELAQNASGRNSGYVVSISDTYGPFDPRRIENYKRINRINDAGLAILRDLVKTHAIDCQWREDGYYRVAADKAALAGNAPYLSYLQALEIPHEALEADALSARLGTRHYKAGIKVAAGALLQPAALLYGLRDTLPATVTLHENSPVTRIERGSTIKLTLPDGRVETDNLIIAANYETPKLGVLNSFMGGAPLLGSTLSTSCTRRLTDEEMATLGSETSWGVLSLHSGGATIRLTTDRRIAIRNTAEYNGGALLSRPQLEQRLNIHRTTFEQRFPQLAHVPFEQSWSCVEGISWNGTCFFGREADNIYYAGGYNGSGLSRGTAFGTALADWASGSESQLITDCLGFPKARWLPPRPLVDIGAWFTVRNRFRGVGLDR